MKRAMPWSDEEDNSSSLSQSDSDGDEDNGETKASFRVKGGRSSKEKDTEGYYFLYLGIFMVLALEYEIVI